MEDVLSARLPSLPHPRFAFIAVIVVRQNCVSKCDLRARHIALQRETPYQSFRKAISFVSMSDRPPGLPEEAQEVSFVGFNRYVGPFFRLPDAEDGGTPRFAFVVADKHMNAGGTIHGGMLMSFVDMAMGQTARLTTGASGGSTVSLNCDFVGPGRLGDVIEAQVRVTRRARTMIFLSAEIRAGDRLLLVATGLWKVIGAT
jgi:acyl-coenzyme A thioesterase 13